MSIDSISRNPSTTTKASGCQKHGANGSTNASTQPNQADEILKRRQLGQTTLQPVINPQGQPTGSFVNTAA